MTHFNETEGTRKRASVDRIGDHELVAIQTFEAPPSRVFRAWSEPGLFQRWWVPQSVPGLLLILCDMDVATGGKYRLEFGAGGSETMSFFGRYLEVIPNQRIVWTNDEGGEGPVTTVTFEDTRGKTLLTFHEICPSKDAVEEALQGSAAALPEQLDQLDILLSSTVM
jgi:uncharacterized protein YndB with AHSA1/START domain